MSMIKADIISDIPSEYYLKQAFDDNVHLITDSTDDSVDKWATFLSAVISVIRNSDGELMIFNYARHYYVSFEKWLMQIIFKDLCDRACIVWSSELESGTYAVFTRNVRKVVEEFNTLNAVNLRNGVLFLDNGKLEPHTPSNTLFTYCCNYNYDKNAKCNQFLATVNFACQNDEELIKVLQEIFGYSLSTETKLQKAFFLIGKGANGKSVLVETLSEVVGKEVVSNVPLENLADRFGLQGLIGCKVNISNESSEIPNSSILKSITGGDTINIRVKYHPDCTKKLYCKMICVLNELPTTSDVSHGFFRRIVVFPFNATVQPEQMNKNLKNELLEELPGILLWCYEGYKRLRDNGFTLSHSDVIEEENRKYMESENHTGLFFTSTYEENSNSKILRSDIYKDYELWADNVGETKMPRQKFYKAISIKSAETGANFKWIVKRIKGYQYVIGYRKRG